MEHLPQLVIDLALLLATAGIVTVVCKKLKQPLVLGYVIAGFLISPAIGFVPNIIDTENIETWSEIGVIFLMFGLGLEFSIMKLTTVGKPAIITAIVEMVFMITAGFITGTLLGWSLYTCLFLGGMLAISSTTIIIKTFDELGLKSKKSSDLVFGALIIEDIIGIFLMVVLSTIAVGSALDGGQVAYRIGQMVLYLIIWFALSIIIVPTILQKIARAINDEIILIVSIALCLAMVVLAVQIGFSAALGAFVAGSILAGTVQGHRVEKLFKPIKDLFGAVFFVSVGMLVSPQLIVDNIIPIIAVTLVTLIAKPIFSTLGAFVSGQSVKTSLMTGLSLSQIGEFSFIIAALGVSLGVTADFLYPIIVAVSVVTTLTTPFYIRSADTVYRAIQKIIPDSAIQRIDARAKTRREPKESSAWFDFLKHWIIKVLMVVFSAIASVEILTNLARPLLAIVLPEELVAILITVLAIAITGIFISNLFNSGRKGGFGILWSESRRYHVPLVLVIAIGFTISAGMIAYIIMAMESGSPWIPIPALLITLLLTRSTWLHTRFLELESRFIVNLNERMLEEKHVDHSKEDRVEWVEDHLFLACVPVLKIHRRQGGHIPTAIYIAQACRLDLIAIKRGEQFIEQDLIATTKREDMRERIMNPSTAPFIEQGDILTFLGTEDEIGAFLNNMERAGAATEDDCWQETLGEFLNRTKRGPEMICFSLRIASNSKFRGKTIGAIDFKSNYGCLVLGMERNLLPIMKPSRNTKLAQKDLVLLLGPEKVALYFEQTENEIVVTPSQIANRG